MRRVEGNQGLLRRQGCPALHACCGLLMKPAQRQGAAACLCDALGGMAGYSSPSPPHYCAAAPAQEKLPPPCIAQGTPLTVVRKGHAFRYINNRSAVAPTMLAVASPSADS